MNSPAMMTLLNRLINKARNNPDYVGAVATGYLFIAFNIALQIVLVPLYLQKLEPYRFGILMMLLSFVNFTTIGIYGFSGSVLRVLGEHAVAGNRHGFVQSYGLARTLLIIYGIILAIVVMVGGLVFDDRLFGAASGGNRLDVDVGLALTAVYIVLFLEFGLNRVALLAQQRQTQANFIHIVYYVVFGATVVPWLLNGGGLAGVVGCLLLGVIVARSIAAIVGRRVGIVNVPWVWPSPSEKPLLERFIGPLGSAYFFYGVLFILLQTDVLIVGWLSDPTVAGQYVLVWKIAEVIVLILWRIPEHLQPEFIRMDATGDEQRLRRVYRQGLILVRCLALVAAFGYGLLGPWMVRIWVGTAHAPTDRWVYMLAGAAIFWLASARMPAVFAYAAVRLKPLLRVAAIEVLSKLVLIFLVFPIVGYIAPLIAINTVHIFGVAWMYARLGRAVPSKNQALSSRSYCL